MPNDMTPPSLSDRLLAEADAFKCGAASSIGMISDPEACEEIASLLQEAAAALDTNAQQRDEAFGWWCDDGKGSALFVKAQEFGNAPCELCLPLYLAPPTPSVDTAALVAVLDEWNRTGECFVAYRELRDLATGEQHG